MRFSGLSTNLARITHLVMAIIFLLVSIGHAVFEINGIRLPLILSVSVPLLLSLSAFFLVFFHLKIDQISLTDHLTGIKNREAFFSHLNQLIKRKRQFHLIIVDINRIRQINDVHGQLVGDLVIKEVSNRLRAAFRCEDVVTRTAGNEFSIILLVGLEREELKLLLSRVISRVTLEPIVIRTLKLPVTLAVGVVNFPADSENADELVSMARHAMLVSKQNKLPFFLFDKSQYVNPSRELKLLDDLRTAVRNGFLDVVYQAKLSLKTGEVMGCEALMRWNHATRGSVDPEIFIQLAEKEHLINELFTFVVHRAFGDFALIRKAGFDIEMAVNVSAENLCSIESVSTVIRSANEYHIDLNRVILEVTETAILKNLEEAVKYLVMLTSFGIKLSIDDFGTGSSSFIYLKHLPISEIKMDRTFIHDMLTENADKKIILSIIQLAQLFNILTVAEGVESREQQEFLMDHGCDFAQGFYIARPMKLPELLSFLRQHERGRKETGNEQRDS